MRTHHLALTLALGAAALASGCCGTHPWCNKWCAPRPAVAAAVPAPCCPPGTAAVPAPLPPGTAPAGAVPAYSVPAPPPPNGMIR